MKLGTSLPAALALTAAASLACQRPAAEARPESSRVAPVESEDVAHREPRRPGGPPPVLWVGLDGVDWEFMDRLSAEGKLPNWSRLVSEGASYRLSSFMPILSPVVWTTIATGVGPDLHRVLDFQEVDPRTGQKVPITGESRAVPAVWNLASSRGLRVEVVGWWATHPAERVHGDFVSDRASPILYSAGPSPGVAYPPALEETVERVVARDGPVSPSELAVFLDMDRATIEAALASGEGMNNKVVALSRILGATRVTQRLARELYDRDHPDLAAVYFEGTDEIGHVFAPFTPPKMDCVSDADYARYHRAAEAYFGVVDRILGQWMRRAREDGATLIVNSDHGFRWGGDRTCERSSQGWSTAAFWHRMEGVLVAWGARVRPAGERGPASVFDMAPTVLALLGLPADPAMPGRPVLGAFRDVSPPAKAKVLASCRVERVPSSAISPERASEFTKKLRALGYLSGGEDSSPAVAPAPGAARPGITEGGYNNLGLYERDTRHDLRAAEADFRKALEIRPGYHSPMFNIAVLHKMRGEDADALSWLWRAFAAGHADPEDTILHWAADYHQANRPAAEKALLEKAAASYPQSEPVARSLGEFRFRGRDCRGALEAVERFEGATNQFQTLNALGLYRTCLGERERAISLFRRSLAAHPGQAGVVQSLRILEKGPGEGN